MTIKEINKMCNTNFNSVEEFQRRVNWGLISKYQKLDEDFIREFRDKVKWNYISWFQKLSSDFIREFQNEVDWAYISKYQNLSESFIREFHNKVYWYHISRCQKLSSDFIREFQDEVYWACISKYQNLNEEFIREFQNKVKWAYISKYQKLSESFIREFQDKVYWYYISICQKLDEDFIREFQDKLDIGTIQNLWHYKDTEYKKQAVIKTGRYDCHDDYFIAYKGIRSDRYSNYNFQYQYLEGQTYESWCDCSDEDNSFGLSVWDYENAYNYCPELVVKVKVMYEDVGRVVHNGGKVRCFKIEILD